VIAFRLPGGFPVYVYAMLLGLSATLGLVWVVWRAPDEQEGKSRVEAGLCSLLGGLVVGRLAEAGYHWAYYQPRLGNIPVISSGGFSWSGALVGGFFGIALYAWLAHKPLGVLTDALFPLLAAVTIGAWIGSWIDGYAYGIVSNSWWGLPAQDEWGRTGTRIPVQLLGVLTTLGISWLVERQVGHFPGWKAALGTLGICLELFALSFLRADPVLVWNGLRLDAWIALAFASVCTLLLWMVPKYLHPAV
jgi:prolipoprotein diacylglyceryltransferase